MVPDEPLEGGLRGEGHGLLGASVLRQRGDELGDRFFTEPVEVDARDFPDQVMGDGEVVMLLGAKEFAGDRALAASGLGAADLPRGGIVRASRALELPVVLDAVAVDVRKNPESIHRSFSVAVGVGLWRCHGPGPSYSSIPAMPGQRSGVAVQREPLQGKGRPRACSGLAAWRWSAVSRRRAGGSTGRRSS